MISRMSYVVCDECGNPGELADDAKEARAIMKRQRWSRTEDGRDLCRHCNGSACLRCGVVPENVLIGCKSRDGIHEMVAQSDGEESRG